MRAARRRYRPGREVTGIAAKAIRFYEVGGLLPVPSRTGSGHRQDTAEEVEQLLFVRRVRVPVSRYRGRFVRAWSTTVARSLVVIGSMSV
jgi:hypothetical protein